MNVLADSNPEILAFNCVSFSFFTIVNNVWTWVAVITAAVSIWRMKYFAAGCTTSSSSCNVLSGLLPSKCDQTLNGSISSDDEPASSDSASAIGLISHGENEIAVTKGVKFIDAYYVDKQEVDGELTVEDENDLQAVEGCRERWESWDKELKMRMGDVSWYRYQDLTDLNGNVVRFWDDCIAKKSYGTESFVV